MSGFEGRIFDEPATDDRKTIAGVEVIGALPSVITDERDGEKTVEDGSISVVYDPDMRDEENFSDMHEE